MSFYVYLHKKKTNGEVFYVGKGSSDRAWVRSGRNKLWHAIVKKHGYIVEIYERDLQEWYAFELEKDLISLYGRIKDSSGTLVNMTDGGEGISGEDHPLYDNREWTFVNIDTEEEIKSTKYKFNKTHPHVYTGSLFSGSASSHRWYVKELMSEEQLNALRSNYTGQYSITGDKKKYKFINLRTLEKFETTRYEMSKHFPDINLSGLIVGYLKSSKGWALKDVFEEYGAEFLLNYNAGKQNGRADLGTYSFTNMLTGEVFVGTRFDFKDNFGFNPRDLFTERLNHVIKDWCLSENYEIAKQFAQTDYTVYTFNHNVFGEFTGTRKQFKENFGHSVKALFTKNPLKTCKGWSLSPQQPE